MIPTFAFKDEAYYINYIRKMKKELWHFNYTEYDNIVYIAEYVISKRFSEKKHPILIVLKDRAKVLKKSNYQDKVAFAAFKSLLNKIIVGNEKIVFQNVVQFKR